MYNTMARCCAAMYDTAVMMVYNHTNQACDRDGVRTVDLRAGGGGGYDT